MIYIEVAHLSKKNERLATVQNLNDVKYIYPLPLYCLLNKNVR